MFNAGRRKTLLFLYREMGNVRTSVAGENKDNVPISFVRCLSLRPMVKGLGYVMNRAAVVFIFHTLFY